METTSFKCIECQSHEGFFPPFEKSLKGSENHKHSYIRRLVLELLELKGFNSFNDYVS